MTSKVLLSIILGRHIVRDSFIEALAQRKACSDPLPSDRDHAPVPKEGYNIDFNPKRKELFSGLLFIFVNPIQVRFLRYRSLYLHVEESDSLILYSARKHVISSQKLVEPTFVPYKRLSTILPNPVLHFRPSSPTRLCFVPSAVRLCGSTHHQKRRISSHHLENS